METALRKKQVGGLQFYRQKLLSCFVVDFYCPAAQLVIELDGIHHYENQQAAYDTERDYQLVALGLTVFRFSNWRVEHDLARVLGEIEGAILRN